MEVAGAVVIIVRLTVPVAILVAVSAVTAAGQTLGNNKFADESLLRKSCSTRLLPQPPPFRPITNALDAVLKIQNLKNVQVPNAEFTRSCC